MDVPELRFPEFSGEWEEKKLVDIAKFSKGKGISKKDISEEGIPCIRYGELYTTYKEKISDVVSKTNLSKDELVFSSENDIIIPTSGETAIDIATASCVINEGIGIGGDTTIIKTKGDGLFFSYYLNSKRKNIAKLAQGVSVVHLYSTHLKILDLKVPQIEEQEKIASFLSKVDEKIGFLEKKQELWKTYKKGIMQQIFSQELRFKDENGADYPDWEEKVLGDLIAGSSSNLSINNLENNAGVYPLYGAVGFMKNIDFYEKDEKYIAIIKDGAGVGRTLLCDKKSSILGTMQYLTSKDQNELIFTYYLMSYMNFKKYIIGSTIPHIYYKDYSKEKINVPTFSEQRKIANLLGDIDLKIDQIKKENKITKEFKKGLLQKLFC